MKGLRWTCVHGLGVNGVVCSILAIVVVRIFRKYEARRKQLKEDIKAPGLENLRGLFEHRLKEQGVDENDKTNSSH